MRLNITHLILKRWIKMSKINLKKIAICMVWILIIFTPQIFAAPAIRVMAAASLQEPLNEIKEKFESKQDEYELEINYAGSQVLYSQIKLGVEFDLFLSANQHYLEQLKNENLIGKNNIFAKNELIIIINSNKKKVDNLEELISKKYSLIIGDASVPVGDYTVEMINYYLNSISDKERKKRLRNNFNSAVVSREFDVKSVLNKVKIGAANAGIVYLSDYNQDKTLHKVRIPAKYNVEAVYYMGLSQYSKTGAVKFYNYIFSNPAQEIFEKYNFQAGEKING